MRAHIRQWGLVLIFLLALSLPALAYAQAEQPQVMVLNLQGALSPAMEEYLARGLRTAAQQGATLVVVQLNTPGGSIDLMSRMEQDIRASNVPVVVYVAPNGAMAASAGTIITLSGHIAAMAPETAIGAASPVGPGGQDLAQTEATKTKEIIKAEARALVERRGQGAISLAEAMIDDARAVSANEALKAGLIDFIATDLNDLLHQVNGFSVAVHGSKLTLNTENANAVPLPTSFIEQLLTILTNPNIVFTLLSIGVMALLIEFYTPGAWVPGFTGVVCLSLAAYGLGVLSVQWFGLIFVATAFILFVLDVKTPTHGALTAAGVGSLIVGGLVLFNSSNAPSFQHVSVPLVVTLSLIIGLVFFGLMLLGLTARKAPLRTGMESLVGKEGVAQTALDPSGNVQCASELWSAELEQGEAPAPIGARVKVVRIHGLHLIVRRIE